MWQGGNAAAALQRRRGGGRDQHDVAGATCSRRAAGVQLEPPEGGSAAEPRLGGLCQLVRVVGRPSLRIVFSAIYVRQPKPAKTPQALWQCVAKASSLKDRASRKRAGRDRGRPEAACVRAFTEKKIRLASIVPARTMMRRRTIVRFARLWRESQQLRATC